jgi:hypothetical protein
LISLPPSLAPQERIYKHRPRHPDVAFAGPKPCFGCTGSPSRAIPAHFERPAPIGSARIIPINPSVDRSPCREAIRSARRMLR